MPTQLIKGISQIEKKKKISKGNKNLTVHDTLGV